jgi:hypothetical protein
MVENTCMHCLEEGDWADEDACPSCRAKGHVSPWAVSQCPACNKEYFDKMADLLERCNIRKKGVTVEEYNKALEIVKNYKICQGYSCKQVFKTEDTVRTIQYGQEKYWCRICYENIKDDD